MARDKDPYKKPDLATEPYAIYFYYFRPSVFGNSPKVLFTHSKANKADIWTIKRFCTEAAEYAALDIDVPPPCEPGFAWRKKSYLVIMVDEDGWEFDNPAITFKTDAGYLDNHTFYHAEHDSITIHPEGESKRKRPIFYCINHMTQSLTNDGDVGPHPQKFRLEIRGNRTEFDSLTADGTNLGPPVPPPATRFLKSLLLKFLGKLNGLLGI